MEVSISEIAGTTILVVQGKIDSSTVPDLEKELKNVISQGKRKLLLNFSGVTYISSSGLRVLLTTAKQLRAGKGSLKLCSLNTDVYKVFTITGFTSIFEIYPNEEEALA